MPYPAQITSLGNGWDLGNSPNGDKGFAYNGTYYLFLRQGGTGGTPSGDLKIRAYKSVDLGLTWAEVGTAPNFNANIYSGNQDFTVARDGSTAYVMAVTSTPSPTFTGLEWATLDLLTDTWGGIVTSATVVPAGVTAFNNEVLINLVARGPSDFVLLYSGPRENVGGTEYGRVYYSRFDGASLSVGVALPSQAGLATKFFPNNLSVDLAGLCHFYYSDGGPGASGNNFNVYHVSLDNTNSFGTTQVITDQAYLINEQGQNSRSISYLNGAVNMLGIAIVMWDDVTSFPSIAFWSATAAVDPTWASNTVFIGTAGDGHPNIVSEDVDFYVIPQHITLAEQGGTLEIVYLKGDDIQEPPCGYDEVHADVSDPSAWSSQIRLFDVADTNNQCCQVTSFTTPEGVGIFGGEIGSGTNQEVGQFFLIALAPPAPTCSLSSLISGNQVTLTWTTTGSPTSAVIDQGIGAVDPSGGTLVLPLPGGSTTYHLVVTSDSGSSTCQTTVTPPPPPVVGGCRTILMLWQGSFVEKPEMSKDRFGDWDDGGTNHLKFYQGFRLKADTFGAAKSILVRDADSFGLHAIQPASVQHSGEVTHAYSFDTPFYAHQVRDEPQDLVAWRRFGIEWVFELAPENVRTWQTQRTAHGITGYQHISRIEAAYAASADVTLTLTAFDGTSPASIILPSTGGQAQKLLLTLTPNKGLTYSYRAISAAPFQLWLNDWVIWVGGWNRQGPYMAYRNLGDQFGDAATI